MIQATRRRRRFRALLLFGAMAIGAWPLACNVFVSLERCQTDMDCPAHYTCDPSMRYCVDRRVDTGVVSEAAPPDVVDANTADVVDASADADAAPPCNLLAPFASIAPVKGLAHMEITSARITSDERMMILSTTNGCTAETCIDLFIASRQNTTLPFVVSGLFPGVNTPASSEYWPSLTSDVLLLFLESSRSLTKVDGGYVADRGRIWSSTRPTPAAQFGEPYIQDIFLVPPDVHEGSPYLHPNGKTLYFASTGRPDNKGEGDIFVAELGDFGAAKSVKNLAEVNTAVTEQMPLVSLDERVLYFARDDGFGRRIMFTSRSSPTSAFNTPTPVTELNTAIDWPSWLSDDQCRLYFVSNRSLSQSDAGPTDAGGQELYRLWVAEHPQ